MQIGGVQKTSLLDFPDKISAIVLKGAISAAATATIRN